MKTIDEVLEVTAQVLIRCAIMGVAVLFIWAAALQLMGDFAYTVHSCIVPMSRHHFNLIHYTGMLATKAAVSLLFFFPWIAIKLVIRKRKKDS